jgi:hypothetical protein
MTPRDRDEVKEIVEDAEEIKDDPEGWAEDQEDDLDDGEDESADPVGKTAKTKTAAQRVADRYVLHLEGDRNPPIGEDH